jgi:hypothetical protein
LTHLAAELNVAGATQNQALNALVFLYKEVPKRIREEMSRHLERVKLIHGADEAAGQGGVRSPLDDL